MLANMHAYAGQAAWQSRRPSAMCCNFVKQLQPRTEAEVALGSAAALWLLPTGIRDPMSHNRVILLVATRMGSSPRIAPLCPLFPISFV